MSSELTPLLLLVVLLLVFWLVVLRPARNQQRNQRSLQDSLEVGDEVVISSGIFGTITTLEDAQVHIEVAPGTVLRVARQVVVRRVEDDAEPATEDEKPFAGGLLGDGSGEPDETNEPGSDEHHSDLVADPSTGSDVSDSEATPTSLEKAPAKKAPAKKTAGKKAPAKKTAAKKAPAKKAPATSAVDARESTEATTSETASEAVPEQPLDDARAGDPDRT